MSNKPILEGHPQHYLELERMTDLLSTHDYYPGMEALREEVRQSIGLSLTAEYIDRDQAALLREQLHDPRE